MLLTSLPLVRSSAAVVLALTLTGCFSSHPCGADTDDDTVVEGQLDYAFNDGAQTSVEIAPGDNLAGVADAGEGAVSVSWKGPLSASTGAVPEFLLSVKLPDADGSFDLGPLSARVCACHNGFVSDSGQQVSCVVIGTELKSPAECQPITGSVAVHRLNLGDCAVKGGCRKTTVVNLLLTSPAEEGLSGNFSFTHTTTSVKRSCVDLGLPSH